MKDCVKVLGHRDDKLAGDLNAVTEYLAVDCRH